VKRLAAAMLLAAAPAFGCINVVGKDLAGKPVTVGWPAAGAIVAYMTDEQDPGKWRRVKNRIAVKLGTATLDERNDLAASLLHIGEVPQAIEILTRIEREAPGRYATATNLGTAYELAGDNRRAVQWIREGIRRNPDSHHGTEWLHVRILDAKLAMEKDPRWLEKNSILAMGFGSALVPNKPARFPVAHGPKKLDAEGTKEAILIQMSERLPLVKAPDPIVGDILFDYANLLMRTDILESAAAVYALAIEYGGPRTALAKARYAHVEALLDQR
jgi:tetratricopeptide (TPR) repeat protein